jgi:glycosyltransferase involved in cell wall biosynthesis
MKVSFAIPVCNESEELDRLISGIFRGMRGSYEIVVQCDKGNTTHEVYSVLEKHKERIKKIEFPLNGDFASFKNNLKSNCSGDWIVQIDADEELTETFLENIHSVLESNASVEVFLLPRVNTVKGLTDEHIRRWGWNVNDKGWVNFPDWQTRILKNSPHIAWKNKVHEVLFGHTQYSFFPDDQEWCILHHKTIDRQERQNNLYSGIS